MLDAIGGSERNCNYKFSITTFDIANEIAAFDKNVTLEWAKPCLLCSTIQL